jgi:predicted transcriptional regulator
MGRMKKTKITLRVGSTEDFFDRLRDHAKKLDRGETLPPGITITFEDPEDLLEVLTSERVRLLRKVKGESIRISALASGLKRDVRAVSRDVSLLEKAGLLRTSYLPNPGHGRMKVVEPVAREFKLVANL